MIENFVTYEIALKLKEKGFRIPCIAHYCCLDGNILKFNITIDCIRGSNIKCLNGENNVYTDAPTIAQVLKWLRNVKEIYCLPHFEQGIDMWLFCIERPKAGCEFAEYIAESIYDTYEQAALAGIEYVLNNLI